MPLPERQIGKTGIYVAPVALGCWPIAGMTSIDVNDHDSLKTIQASIDSGVNHLDTAYCYGTNGESERMIGRVISGQRNKVVIASKCGIHWDSAGTRQIDGRPETIRRECDESLTRLRTDFFDLYYLHAPDPDVSLTETAGAIFEILESGKVRSIGVSNATVEQLEAFAQACPISAVQVSYNMLQRQIENDIVPWCQERDVSVVVYWPLMKGLLAGAIKRDHIFDPRDGRAKYPMFQGDEWEKNHDFLDELRSIASDNAISVSQLVVHWTISQPGITVALCGAKRAYQAVENANAMNVRLGPDSMERIQDALIRRGAALTGRAV